MSPDPITVLTTALEASSKVTSNPTFMTAIDKWSGFKLSEWSAQSDVIKQQIRDGYEEAKQKGLGIQYASAFRQEGNLLNVASKASTYVTKGFKREIGLEEDVFWNLLEHSKTVSNEDVQDLIARIIAGEYNQQGMYSMSTLHTLKSLGNKELDLFEKAGCLLVNDNHFPVNVFSITEDYETFLKEISIKYPDFQTLQALGLIHSNSGTREIANPEKKDLDINYFDRTLKFSPEADVEGVVKIQIPSFYSLTPVGEQILQHLKPSPNETYYEWLKKNYKVRNYNLKDE